MRVFMNEFEHPSYQSFVDGKTNFFTLFLKIVGLPLTYFDHARCMDSWLLQKWD
jgi:hypothetical protein